MREGESVECITSGLNLHPSAKHGGFNLVPLPYLSGLASDRILVQMELASFGNEGNGLRATEQLEVGFLMEAALCRSFPRITAMNAGTPVLRRRTSPY